MKIKVRWTDHEKIHEHTIKIKVLTHGKYKQKK